MHGSTLYWVFLHLGLQLGTILRILSRDDRDPPVRMSWIVVVLSVPFLGVLLYLLFGEARIARKPRRRMRKMIHYFSCMAKPAEQLAADVGWISPAFARAAAANGFFPVAGNRFAMLEDSPAFIDRLEADIDAATRDVHVAFYIWLTDDNGSRIAAALARAAARGVTCRCLVDGLGARGFIGSEPWQQMLDAGVRTAVAFPFRWSLLQMLRSRIDIRYHRKIVVIDGQAAYCGSQNCADPAFAIKPRFAPWVDVMVRMTGPVVWQMQALFVTDWVTHSDDGPDEVMPPVLSVATAAEGGATAIALGSGPEMQKNAVTDMFQAVIGAARQTVTITTPYYVPDLALHNAIAAAATRGVDVQMLVPRRNDSAIVARASRSFYMGLLRAGVRLYEYEAGFLHAKILVVDGTDVVIGSANMDRRSLDLNYENSILARDPELAARLIAQVDAWRGDCREITLTTIARWTLTRRISNNLAALFSPLV